MQVRAPAREPAPPVDHHRTGGLIDDQAQKVCLGRSAAATDTGPDGIHPSTVAPWQARCAIF